MNQYTNDQNETTNLHAGSHEGLNSPEAIAVAELTFATEDLLNAARDGVGAMGARYEFTEATDDDGTYVRTFVDYAGETSETQRIVATQSKDNPSRIAYTALSGLEGEKFHSWTNEDGALVVKEGDPDDLDDNRAPGEERDAEEINELAKNFRSRTASLKALVASGQPGGARATGENAPASQQVGTHTRRGLARIAFGSLRPKRRR